MSGGRAGCPCSSRGGSGDLPQEKFDIQDDSGYPHDGCGDKNPYPHDCRVYKNSYPYDSNNKCIILSYSSSSDDPVITLCGYRCWKFCIFFL